MKTRSGYGVDPGDLVQLEPFKYEYNPVRNSPPFIGLYLDHVPDPNRWRPAQWRILGPQGIVMLYTNQWAIELVR